MWPGGFCIILPQCIKAGVFGHFGPIQPLHHGFEGGGRIVQHLLLAHLGQLAVLHHDHAVHNGAVHILPHGMAHQALDGHGAEGGQVGLVHVHSDDIGPLAHLQGTHDVVQPQGPGGLDGHQLQHLAAGQQIAVLMAEALEQLHVLHIAPQVVAAVRRRAVGDHGQVHAHLQHLLHGAVAGHVGVGGGPVEHIGPRTGQDFQLLLAVPGAVGQRKAGRQHLGGVVRHKLHVTAVGVGVQRHIVLAGDAEHLPVVADVGLVALILAAAHAPRRHDAGHAGVLAVELAHGFLRSPVGRLRRHQRIFKAAVLLPHPGPLGESAVGAPDAGQLPDAGGEGPFQVGGHRLDSVDARRAAHHGNRGGSAEFQPLRRGQGPLRTPEFRVGTAVIDGLRHLLPTVVQMFAQGLCQAMAAVAVAVHQARQHRMAGAVDHLGGLGLGRQLLHGPQGRDGVALHGHIPFIIDVMRPVHRDHNAVFQ